MKDKEHASVEDVDLNILGVLSENSRENYNQISHKLDKSPVTVKKHVEELEKNGIIKGYGINIDFEKLGYNIIATIEITVSKGKMIEVETDIAENPNVFGVYDITGDYDALVFARFKTRKELSEMIKKLHASPNVERTNTHLILNVIKEGSSFVKLLEKEKKMK
ncbi:MAG: Lrp/AsnC family transcriptional regulator [Candidatus Lokiarchaeota archaeon]|nr:Lrp/AsnC family transcriptional regulator [Candidatus Lokiarchaeota archaeon]